MEEEEDEEDSLDECKESVGLTSSDNEVEEEVSEEGEEEESV